MGIPYAQEEAYNAEHCIQTVEEEEAKQASHLTVLTDIQFCVNILSAKKAHVLGLRTISSSGLWGTNKILDIPSGGPLSIPRSVKPVLSTIDQATIQSYFFASKKDCAVKSNEV